VAEAVPFGPVSAGIFPANREKNREFGENRSRRPDSDVICVCDFNRLRANSAVMYLTKVRATA
jgi:hypothetical protein